MQAGSCLRKWSFKASFAPLFVGVEAKTGIPCSLSRTSLFSLMPEAPGGWPVAQVLRESRMGMGCNLLSLPSAS